MADRPTYKTKQREILMDYLENRPGVHITAGDVCEYLKIQGATIGQSTVYRQLERLVDEGKLNKYVLDNNTPACFEYVGEAHKEGGDTCYHCKCEKCGKLIHLHCEEMNEFREHLYQEHHFRLDSRRTVLYGICEDCQE